MSSALHEDPDKKLTILLIEDDEKDYIATRDLLRSAPLEDYTLEWVSEYDAAVKALKGKHVSVCLLDYRIGKRNGLTLLKKFGKDIEAPPIIFLTGKVDFELDKKAMLYGAEDFLDKSRLTTDQLERSIRYAIAHRQDQRELIRKEAHYHHIVDVALNAIVAIDEEGRIIEWNPRAEEVFGWSSNETMGKHMAELIIPPRYRAAHYKGMNTYFNTGSNRILDKQLEFSALKREGEEIPIRLTVTAVEYPEHTHFVAFIEDLSRQKYAEEQARRYQQIVTAASDHMAFIDTNFRYLAANNAYADLINKPLEDIAGNTIDDILGKDSEVVKSNLAHCFKGHEITQNASFELPGGDRCYMHIHYTPYRDARDEITGAVVVARDITDLRKSQESITRARKLQESISRIQARYIAGETGNELFEQMLDLALEMTESEFGFIGDVKYDARNEPYIVLRALSDISWDSQSGQMYKDALEGKSIFNNMNSLFGAVVTSGDPVISNNPPHDPRSGGLPEGHPQLTAFLGIPFKHRHELLGIIGLANRPNGYTENVIDSIRLIITTCEAIVNGLRADEKRRQAESRYRYLYDENPAIFMTVTEEGMVVSMNAFGREQLGLGSDMIDHITLFDIMHPADRQLARMTLMDIFANPDQISTWEMRMRHSNGRTFWVRNTARVVTVKGQNDAALIVCEDITKTRELSEQLSYQATHDPLTGFVNRREFERRLSNAINHARLHGVEHALCYIDLDQFKVINDTAGHAAGDNLLRQLAALLNTKIRQRDTLARIGGDEFAVLVEHCTLDQARRVAELLRQAITEFSFPWENRHFRIGASIGVVAINQNSTDLVDVMRIADSACYAAKDAGRNSIHVYEESDRAIHERRGEMLWVERVQNAIDQDRFELFYQDIKPVIPLDEGRHFEILIRLKNENGTMVHPGAFLPASERYNIIGKLDRWVIREVFRWFKQNPKARSELSLCSINLSGQSFGDESILGFIREQLMLYNIDPGKICFEITETAAITNINNAIYFMQECRSYGFHFALDDFGSGLSSFGYLKTLPVDFVKIDGIFIREIGKSEIDLAMVKSINEVAHVMGKKTIAEFVENKKILSLLRKLNVDYAQGFGIGKPKLLSGIADIPDNQ